MPAAQEVTQILAEVREGRGGAVDRLLPVVYAELRQLAARSLRQERGDHTLQATALVHEAYLRLIGQTQTEWRDRAHFFAAAGQTIRRVLVDHARARGRKKRSCGRVRVHLDEALVAESPRDIDVIALDEALTRLSAEAPRKAAVVEMRFFGGATVEEVAEVYGVSSRSIERDWQFARAWLFREIAKDGEGTGGGRTSE